MTICAHIFAKLVAIDAIAERRPWYLKYAYSFTNRGNFGILVGFDCELDPTLLIDRILGILIANRGHGG
jgi:hypothetical protein